MKIHYKLILSLFGILILVVPTAQVVNNFIIADLLTGLSHSNIELLKKREKNFANNFFKSVERSIKGSLEKGEMEKFRKLLEAQQEIEGLLEFSLYNQDYQVSHSSDLECVGKNLSESIKSQIIKHPKMYLHWTDDAIEIYNPQIIRNYCVRCHTNWKAGEIGGVLHFRFSTESLAISNHMFEKTLTNIKSATTACLIISLFIICCILLISMYFLVNRFVSRPLNNTVTMLKDIAEGDGDLTRHLKVKTNDEVGEMAKWFNIFVDKLRMMIRKVAEYVNKLNENSEHLTLISNNMALKAQQMSEHSSNVTQSTEETAVRIRQMASLAKEVSSQIVNLANSSEKTSANMMASEDATEEVSTNLEIVAASSEEMSYSISTVASAIKNMNESLSGVAINTGKGAELTHVASEKSSQSTIIITDLNAAAEEISNVVELIKDIATQTNLLALNATIEAVSAGEAGKGFAIVANEVKELSRQTAGATEEIRQKVESMQNNSIFAVDAIKTIENGVNEIHELMSNIAKSVENQTETMNGISISISQAATAANSVSKNINQAAKKAADTSKNVQEVVKLEVELSKNLVEMAQSAKDIAQNADEASKSTDDVAGNVTSLNTELKETSVSTASIKTNADDLANLAKEFQVIIEQFKI